MLIIDTIKNKTGTYGLFSINAFTFKIDSPEQRIWAKPLRDVATTALRVNNAALHILGYMPAISPI